MSFSLAGVGLTYVKSVTALDDIRLVADQGEQIALVGPSGAGKTTLLGVIGTALRPASGQVEVLGVAPGGQGEAALRRLRCRIGTVHQAPPLPGRQRAVTAVLAGRLGRWPAWKALASLLYPVDIAGAHAVLARLDLADKLFQRCDCLSGGQLQRVGIARVLYQEPDMILADEPVSALDPAQALATVRLLCSEAADRKATLVASLHAVDLALACFPRIVGIKAGGIAFDLPAAEVSDALLHDLYASEGEALPTLATEQRLAVQAAGTEAARRAACC